MKTIIIIEHNSPKEFLLKKAREKNYRIIMVANKFNEMFLKYLPREDILITDVFNLQTITEETIFFCEKNNLKIDAVGTFSEDLVVATSDIASLLGCKSIGQISSRVTSSNKLAMRVKLRESKIRQPDFDIFNIFDDNEKILRAFPKPCVIKPIFGTSSHGVLLIESDFFDYKKISETIRATVNQEHRESFKRFHGNMLIEEYVPGKMISLDGFVVGGQISVIGSIEFIMGKEPYFTQVASYIPARLTEKEQEVINKYLKSIIETLGFINSPFHAEFRIKDGEPYLVEIAGRMAGALIHETYDRVYGIDMLNLMYDCWLGNSIPLNYFSKGINYHELFYPQIKHSGILKEISGLDSLKNIKNLCNVKIISEIGMELKTYPDLPTPLFEYSIFSKDLNEINNVIDTVNKLIKYKII